MAINTATIEGYLHNDVTKEELLKASNGNSYIKFSFIMASQKKDSKSEFMSCTAFGKTAEYIHNYGTKGSRIFATGSIRAKFLPDGKQNGNTLMCENVSLITKASTSSDNYVSNDNVQPEVTNSDFNDEDLPF